MNSQIEKIIPLIPAYQPDEKLIKYAQELIKKGFKKILIINDGSNEKYENIFKQLKAKQECVVIENKQNMGKGQALKAGFLYYLNNLKKDYYGIVTVDCDGQHTVKDAIKIAQIVEKNKNDKSLILGVRDFSKNNVPARSKIGNNITKIVFKLLYGRKILDTQTGLRGITNSYIEDCLKISGDRYEYEINMLINATKNKIKITEQLIDTVYINENHASHFNPIKDSIKIYKILFMNFIKFSCSGIISFIVDWGLFVILSNYILDFLEISKLIVFSTIIARIISSIVNFILNKNLVFNIKDNKNIKLTLIKYYILCILQMLVSACLVLIFTNILPISKNIIKIIVDLLLFFISYKIQQNYIFIIKRKGKA